MGLQGRQQFRQHPENNGANHRPGDEPRATNDHHQYEQNGLHETESIRRYKAGQRREQPSGQPGHQRRQREGHGFCRQWIDTDGFRRHLAVLDRPHGRAPGAAGNQSINQQHRRRRQHGEHSNVLLGAPGLMKRGRHNPHDAVLTTGDMFHFNDGVLNDKAEGDGDHRQIRPLGP